MTLELVEQAPKPGYAGPLEARRHPALAQRFHFWRGVSGRRYACTRFPPHAVPAYDDAVVLSVRRIAGEPVVVGVSTSHGASIRRPDADELHVHIVQDGPEAVNAALRDLRALVTVRMLYPAIDVQRHAA